MNTEQKPDTMTEEEFKNATPERQKAALVGTRVDETMQRYHDALVKLVNQGIKLGVHIEIRTVPLQPLAMGNVASEVTVRPKLALWRALDALEQAALRSEMTSQEQYKAFDDKCGDAAYEEGWFLSNVQGAPFAIALRFPTAERPVSMTSVDQALYAISTGTGEHHTRAREFIQRFIPQQWERMEEIARGDVFIPGLATEPTPTAEEIARGDVCTPLQPSQS